MEATGSGTELATVEDGGGEIPLTEGERAKGISLLDWISAMEGQLTLKRMAEECRINIEKFNRNLLVNLNDRIEKAVKASQNVSVIACVVCVLGLRGRIVLQCLIVHCRLILR